MPPHRRVVPADRDLAQLPLHGPQGGLGVPLLPVHVLRVREDHPGLGGLPVGVVAQQAQGAAGVRQRVRRPPEAYREPGEADLVPRLFHRAADVQQSLLRLLQQLLGPVQVGVGHAEQEVAVRALQQGLVAHVVALGHHRQRAFGEGEGLPDPALGGRDHGRVPVDRSPGDPRTGLFGGRDEPAGDQFGLGEVAPAPVTADQGGAELDVVVGNAQAEPVQRPHGAFADLHAQHLVAGVPVAAAQRHCQLGPLRRARHHVGALEQGRQ